MKRRRTLFQKILCLFSKRYACHLIWQRYLDYAFSYNLIKDWFESDPMGFEDQETYDYNVREYNLCKRGMKRFEMLALKINANRK